MGEVKVNADNVNELWLNNEQFLAFDITKLFSQINFKANVNQIGFVLNVINLSYVWTDTTFTSSFFFVVANLSSHNVELLHLFL